MQKRKTMKCYIRRARKLKQLGFNSYAEYLRSDLWDSIRSSVLSRDGFLCRLCLVRQATQVHHNNYGYRTLAGRDISGLRAVCGGCHFGIEFSRDGQKRNLKNARIKGKIKEHNAMAIHRLNDQLDAEYDAIVRPTHA